MISKEKKKVQFQYEAVNEEIINPDDAHGCVEIWLDRIQTVMRKTIAHLYDLSMVEYAELVGEGKRTDWLRNWPGQVVLGVSQTFWTSELLKH